MRFHINLASQRYEDVQRFFLGWRLGLAGLTLLTILLGGLSFLKYDHSGRNATASKGLQQKIAALQKERERLIAFDNSPENKEVTQQKKFWNSQIARRSLSWTQLLNDLQKIMPARAYLESVQPEQTADQRLKIKLVIVGEKHEDALELVKKMEASDHFHSVKFNDETEEKEGKGASAITYKVDIETEYAPAGSAAREGI